MFRLPTIVIAFSAVAAALRPDAAADVFPRETVSVDTSNPCYTKVESILSGQPTAPAIYQSWTSYLLASAKCTDTEMTGDTLTAYQSWIGDLVKWRSSHPAEMERVTSECGSYVRSRAEASLAWQASFLSSCKTQLDSTSTGGSSVASVSASTTRSSAASSNTGSTTTMGSTITTDSTSTTETSTATLTAASAAATTTDSGARHGVSFMGYGAGLLAVSLNLVHLF